MSSGSTLARAETIPGQPFGLGKGPFLIPFPTGQPQSKSVADPNQSQRHQRLVKQSPNSWLHSIHCANMVRLSRTVTCWQAASMITYAATAGPRIPACACRGCCTSASTWTASTARRQRSRGAWAPHQRRGQHLRAQRQCQIDVRCDSTSELRGNQHLVAAAKHRHTSAGLTPRADLGVTASAVGRQDGAGAEVASCCQLRHAALNLQA
jgi:hypothetical protein